MAVTPAVTLAVTAVVLAVAEAVAPIGALFEGTSDSSAAAFDAGIQGFDFCITRDCIESNKKKEKKPVKS